MKSSYSKMLGKHCLMDCLVPPTSLHAHYLFYYQSWQIVIQLQPRDEVSYSCKWLEHFPEHKYTSLWGNFLFFDSSHFDKLSFLELLTHYNYSELVSSILHMTTPENAWDDYHILSKAFSPHTPRPSFCHSLPAPSACTNLSLKTPSTAQHTRFDLPMATHSRPTTSLEWDTGIFKTLQSAHVLRT